MAIAPAVCAAAGVRPAPWIPGRSCAALGWLHWVAAPARARAAVELKAGGGSKSCPATLAARFVQLLLIIVLTQTAWGNHTRVQADSLHISLHRRAGYSFGSQVQGVFELRAHSVTELVSVVYFIDGAAVGAGSEPPFSVRFRTGDYAPGWHEVRAEARTERGQSLESNVLRVEFVMTGTAWTVLRRTVVPAGAGVGVVVLVIFVLSFIVVRSKRSRRPDERADVSEAGPGDTPSPPSHAPIPEEALRRRIEESRYTNL